METRIVEAVGFANRHGRKPSALKRFIVWLLFRRAIPLSIRQYFLFRVLPTISIWFRRPLFGLAGGLGFGDVFENDLLKLIFNATDIALIADNTVTTPLTSLYVSLHTTPGVGEGGDQLTNEIAYTSYARVAVARTTGGWTASTAASTSPVANIDFAQSGGGAGGTVTHFCVGTVTTGGAGKILVWGTVTPNIVVSTGVIPRLTTASTVTLD